MSENDYMWKFYDGRVYDLESLKLPHVVPVIESLPYDSYRPVAVDVGGGGFSIVYNARLPRRRYFRTATVDLVSKRHGLEPINPTIQADIDEIVVGADAAAEMELQQFFDTHSDEGVGADLVVFSEVLNYVDFKAVMRWFNHNLKPGGFMVIANLPTRGYANLFSEAGVKSHNELLEFVQLDLGHTIVRQDYPWDATDDHEGFMVLATQKPPARQQTTEVSLVEAAGE